MPYYQDRITIFSEKYINYRIYFTEILASTCTSVVLSRKPVQQKYQRFFKDFKPKKAF